MVSQSCGCGKHTANCTSTPWSVVGSRSSGAEKRSMPRRHAAIQYQGSISTSLTDAAESGYAHPGEDRESRLHRDALPERPNCRIACCTHYKSHRWSLAMYLRPAFVACEHLLQVFAELSAVTFDGPSITVEHHSHAQ